MRVRVADFAGGVTPLDRHAAADEAIDFPVVLDQGSGEIDPGDFLDRLRAGRFRKVRVQTRKRRPQVPNQHHLALGGSSQCPVMPEGLRVVGVDAVPAKDLLQMVGEGLLDKPVFAVDVGYCDGFGSDIWLRFGSFDSCRAGRKYQKSMD